MSSKPFVWPQVSDVGPDPLKPWSAFTSPVGRVLGLFAGVLLLICLLAGYGVFAGKVPMMLAQIVVGIALVSVPACWWAGMTLRVVEVLVLRTERDQVVFSWEWWDKGNVARFPPEAFLVRSRKPLLALDGTSQAYRPLKDGVWRQPLSAVTSEDLARALDQSAASVLLSSKSRSIVEAVKLGVVAVLVAGGAVLIYIMAADLGKNVEDSRAPRTVVHGR